MGHDGVRNSSKAALQEEQNTLETRIESNERACAKLPDELRGDIDRLCKVKAEIMPKTNRTRVKKTILAALQKHLHENEEEHDGEEEGESLADNERENRRHRAQGAPGMGCRAPWQIFPTQKTFKQR